MVLLVVDDMMGADVGQCGFVAFAFMICVAVGCCFFPRLYGTYWRDGAETSDVTTTRSISAQG